MPAHKRNRNYFGIHVELASAPSRNTEIHECPSILDETAKHFQVTHTYPFTYLSSFLGYW